MHSDVTGAITLHPTVHVPREHTAPSLTVARIVSAPEVISVRFRRSRFGNTEFLEIKDRKVLKSFIGIQLMVLNETIGECFGIELPEVLTKHNGGCQSFLSAMAKVAGLDEATMATALVDHNQASVVFVPKACTSSYVISATRTTTL